MSTHGPTEPTTASQTAIASGDKVPNDQLVVTSDKDPNAGRIAQLVSADDIRLCAYQKWEGAGKPAGDGVRFWLQAEQVVEQAKVE